MTLLVGDDVFTPPIAARLRDCERLLIVGAGGGFDVYAGLPLYFALTRAGKRVHLANLTFTYLGGTDAKLLRPALAQVDHRTSGETSYFPERYLAEWLHQQRLDSTIYCFEKVGVRPLLDAYQFLARELRIDAVVLIDGGTDILMRGDEAGLGTPAEDMVSLAAAHALDVPTRVVSCLGFGVDAFHGVCHAHFLENVAALVHAGGYLGAHSLHLSTPEVAMFRAAVEYAHARMPGRESIVNGSIVSAIEGRFGNFHRTERTRNSELFINPLMAMYWHFDLAAVAQQSLYLRLLETTTSIFEVQAIIEGFQKDVKCRPRSTIPV